MIITVGSNKGGTGKTTTATNIAIALTSKEKDVCLIDADFQRSSSKWYQDRQESRIFPTITLVEKYDNISNTIEELNKKFDYIVLSETINQASDVQQLFERLLTVSHSRTRLILNFYHLLMALRAQITIWALMSLEVL